MSQIYKAILTAVGEAKLANAAALNVPLQISRMAVGDGGGVLPEPDRLQPALIGEKYRADLNSLIPDPLNPSQVIAELVIPESIGGWWMREMALYDADGNMIAVCNCPPSYKPVVAEGSGKTQVLRMVLIVSSTAAVQLKIDPSVVLATRAYVDTIAESMSNLITVHMAATDPHKQYRLRGGFTNLNANTQLTAAHEGVVVLDAAAGDRTLTLPPADAAFGIRDILVRRLDNSGNRAKVIASGTNKIKFHTHLNATGYAFLYLMGAGDWWHLRSDGAGGWWPVARKDDSPLGRLTFESSLIVQPGGYGLPHGVLLARSEWPWLWDLAQSSGMLVEDASRAGFEGCWTRGNGTTTMRTPEARAEFIRVLDEGRGLDTSRAAGSWQKGSLQTFDPTAADAFVGGLGHSSPDTDLLGEFGLDAAAAGNYARSSAWFSTSTLTQSISGSSGQTRPRNLAYPARIKLI